MNIIDVFPKLCKLFPGATSSILYFGMTVVSAYHHFCGNILINTSFAEAKGIERVGNILLAPLQYLCGGKIAYYDSESGSYVLGYRYNYREGKALYSPCALTLAPSSLILGSALKGAAVLFSSEVKSRHLQLKAQLESREIQPHRKKYRSIGIDTTSWKAGAKVTSQGYPRRPGDENHLAADKEALKAISELLTAADIPFWVDCGTCIGAYRHGGIIPWDNDLDLSVLVTDYQNVKNALKNLDPKKFEVQDWSTRNQNGNYIRVYVKSSHNHVDIYHNEIDPEAKTLRYIIAHLNSNFMAQKWKERELTQADPIPFEVVFPLKRADFDGIEVPVPNQTERFLRSKYGGEIRPAKIFNEATGEYEKDLSHPYWKIPLAH
ncbi:MAG: LicD family protein [Chlamydiia bacterium]|nr:LicD family protein [Chlamydiia bacterium]